MPRNHHIKVCLLRFKLKYIFSDTNPTIQFGSPNMWSLKMIIRIYHECEGRIEKFVLRIAVWHHEACRVMINGDLEGGIFLSCPHTNNGFIFLLTTFFYLFSIF